MGKFRLCAITARTLLLVVAVVTPALSQNSIGVFTNRYDNGRTGQNRYEKILTPQNVTSNLFGRLGSYSVDGHIYAQPLYVYGVNIPGKGKHNVVYVTTQMDSVYAFDADGRSATPLWQDSFIDVAHGIYPVPCGTDGSQTDISCSVYPFYGITGTPVIDPTTNTMYLVARTFNINTGKGYQHLHALDITSGVEKFGGPVLIEGSVSGGGLAAAGGVITFNSLSDTQRVGLLLANGKVYIGWAGSLHGWLMAYDARTLEQTAIFISTPYAARGGFWQSGNGLAGDSSGNIYASTGDGVFDADSGGLDYGDTLLKLDPNLNVLDYFTPMDQACRLTVDYDLSSSGPLVLPTQPGLHPDEVITSGKGGHYCNEPGAAVYLLDRNNMGKYNPNADNVIQEITGAPAGYWSSPAYWQAGTQGAIYYSGVTKWGGTGDYLSMYSLTNGQLSTTPVSQSPNLFPIGSTPTVSSNGNTNGIVWAVERQESLGIRPGQFPAILFAYDATDVSKMLYSSADNALRDQGGCASKFVVPTVANGKVYVGTQNQLDVFGLLGSPPPAPRLSLSAPCFTFPKQAVGTTSTSRSVKVINSGNATLKLNTISIVGLNAGEYAETNNCPSTLAPGGLCTVKVTFTPLDLGPRVGFLLVTDNAAGSPHNVQLIGKGVQP